MKTVITILLLLLVSSGTYAQNQQKLDSLDKAMRAFEARKQAPGAKATPMMDTAKADILFALIWTYRSSKPDTILSFALPCLEISQTLGYKKGIANAYTGMGFYFNEKLNYPRCLESHQKALALRREIGDKKGIAYSLQQVGIALIDLGNHAEALSSYLEALKFAERAGDSVGIARCYTLLAGIYRLQNKNSDALKYYVKAVAILENNKDNDLVNMRLMDAYGGIADLYLGMKSKTQEAIDYYQKALIFSKEMGSNYYIVNTMGNLGVAFREYGDNRKAIEIFESALQIFTENNPDHFQTDAAHMISWLTQLIGESYERLGNLKKALKYEKLGLPYAMRANQTRRAEAYEALATVYHKMGDYKNAYDYHVKSVVMKDSVAKSVNLEAVNKVQMQNEFTKIQDSTNAEQFKKDVLSENELQKQKLVRNGFIGGFGVVFLFSILIFCQRNKVKREKLNVEREKANVEIEKERSDRLLLNILPAEVAEELKETGTAAAKHFDDVTVLFTDFKSFTNVSEQLTPQELVDELHACFKQFDEICGKYNIEKIKTIGDAYLAVCGLPLADEKHAENVVNAALEIREFMESRRQSLGEKTFEVRIGINSGSVVAGIVGVKKFAYDIWGDTVNTAARMEQNSEAGKINISETTYNLVKEKFTCEYRGEIDAKNKGKLKMYFVRGNV